MSDEKVFDDFVLRKLEIKENQGRQSVTPTGFSITQFQFLKWQENAAPNTTSAILEIANLVQKVQMSTGNKPIVVMCKWVISTKSRHFSSSYSSFNAVTCSDGVGRSGTFITLHAQLERMKSEAVVDIFQFIKSVRFQRAGLVVNEVS